MNCGNSVCADGADGEVSKQMRRQWMTFVCWVAGPTRRSNLVGQPWQTRLSLQYHNTMSTLSEEPSTSSFDSPHLWTKFKRLVDSQVTG